MNIRGYKCYHGIRIQQRISDVDALGHINNGVQQHYYDLARVDYFDSILNVNVDQSNDSLVIANINMNFLQPVYFRDNIEAYSKIIRIGNKSIEMVQFLMDTKIGQIKSWNNTVLVGYNPQDKVSMEISDEWREKINAFEIDVDLLTQKATPK